MWRPSQQHSVRRPKTRRDCHDSGQHVPDVRDEARIPSSGRESRSEDCGAAKLAAAQLPPGVSGGVSATCPVWSGVGVLRARTFPGVKTMTVPSPTIEEAEEAIRDALAGRLDPQLRWPQPLDSALRVILADPDGADTKRLSQFAEHACWMMERDILRLCLPRRTSIDTLCRSCGERAWVRLDGIRSCTQCTADPLASPPAGHSPAVEVCGRCGAHHPYRSNGECFCGGLSWCAFTLSYPAHRGGFEPGRFFGALLDAAEVLAAPAERRPIAVAPDGTRHDRRSRRSPR